MSRSKQQPEQPAQSEEQTLDILDELSKEISRIEKDIESVVAIVKAAPGRIAAAAADYDAAFLRGDTAGMTDAQDRIRAANEERTAAAGRLGDFTKPLEALRDRQATARLSALDESQRAQAEVERARQAAATAVRRVDAAQHVGAKIVRAMALLGSYVPADEKACLPESPAVPAVVKPQCPRCRRSDLVAADGPGRWRCAAAWHGPISFVSGRAAQSSCATAH